MSQLTSPTASADEPATPRAKVQALLAQFSDSDSDQSQQRLQTDTNASIGARDNGSSSDRDEESDEDIPIARKSRMAMRLEAGTRPRSGYSDDATAADKELPARFSPEAKDLESDDDLGRPAPRRKLLTKRKSGPQAAPTTPSVHEASPDAGSPLFFSSPSASVETSANRVSESERPGNVHDDPSTSGTNLRFKALVEKQRRLRAEKEEAERAKELARQDSTAPSDRKRQRGSSPADDSHESSDESDQEGAKKIARASNPARKASKKAVDEMKRETQRMSRNMQLAHQAQVKKRFTKDSFLARFNRIPVLKDTPSRPDLASSRTASPEKDSDVDRMSRHTTPPSSPVEELEKPIGKENAQVGESLTGPGVVLEAPALADIGLEPYSDSSKGKGKLGEMSKEIDPRPIAVARMATPLLKPHSTNNDKAGPQKRSRIAEFLQQSRATEDDGDDLDIISSKGESRKYAAFEHLPKRKAKEMPSHLALRSLAQIRQPDRSRSAMTASEMQASLRRAAREQARRERQARIEELKAKGVVIQTAEEREHDQQEVEDLVEKARQEAAEISKREKAAAKKDGTFVKDGLDDDDDDSDDDEDFALEDDDAADTENNDSDDEGDDNEEDADADDGETGFFDDHADEDGSGNESEQPSADDMDVADAVDPVPGVQTPAPRKTRNLRVLSDDEEDMAESETPQLPQPSKTPQSLLRSTRKPIPGLHMSDDTPLGLTQAFDATMAETQDEEPGDMAEHDSIEYIADLPSPGLAMMPRLNRLESLDMISDSQPASQTQPLNITLALSQSQVVPESPSLDKHQSAVQATPSQVPFEPTQDGGYVFSPFTGNRFASETPQADPHSTIETVMLNELEASPVAQRRNRLRRGRGEENVSLTEEADVEITAFEVMRRAAKQADEPFDKTKSNARAIVDEAAEESDDEYAGLGGVSDDENGDDVENDDDRRMIDQDTQVGRGDEAALAGYHADRERRKDEADVSKLLQDITTGKLRRRRGGNDELDLSDEEDAIARKREAKRREFARMRRELLKDEAVGKIAEDKRKEAFLRSIEDRQILSDDDDLDEAVIQEESQSQPEPVDTSAQAAGASVAGTKRKRVFEPTSDEQLNRLPPAQRRGNFNKKPTNLSEIRENLSFLVEEPDSQASMIDLGLSDSEDEPEKYVDLDRHAREAEADENAEEEDGEGLGDFIVDDEDTDAAEGPIFKKPTLPASSSQTGRDRVETTFSHRRSSTKVVNRLSMLRQSSSSGASTKMAFGTAAASSTFKVPALLRRATTNSSLSPLSSTDGTSATGVTVARTERGHVSEEKTFVRKGNTGRRNAVNFQAGERPQEQQKKKKKKMAMSQRTGVGKRGSGMGGAKRAGGFLGDLLGRSDTWG